MDSNDYPQTTPESDVVLELTLNPDSFDEPPVAPADDWEWHDPGFFARLTVNRPLVILLIIAFLVLVIGPSLFYLLNPPRPRTPKALPGQGFPAFNAPRHEPGSIDGSGIGSRDQALRSG